MKELTSHITNHLGNVLSVVTDNKISEGSGHNNGEDFLSLYRPEVVSYSEYYPFGWQMPTRSSSIGSYRYGFNGKERDDEVKGNGVQYDYGFRIYDSRMARFLSVDPLTASYPMLTPYQFASNRPIKAIDIDGLESSWFPPGLIGEALAKEKIHGKSLSYWQNNASQDELLGLFLQFSLVDVPLAYGEAYLLVEGLGITRTSGTRVKLFRPKLNVSRFQRYGNWFRGLFKKNKTVIPPAETGTVLSKSAFDKLTLDLDSPKRSISSAFTELEQALAVEKSGFGQLISRSQKGSGGDYVFDAGKKGIVDLDVKLFDNTFLSGKKYNKIVGNLKSGNYLGLDTRGANATDVKCFMEKLRNDEILKNCGINVDERVIIPKAIDYQPISIELNNK